MLQQVRATPNNVLLPVTIHDAMSMYLLRLHYAKSTVCLAIHTHFLCSMPMQHLVVDSASHPYLDRLLH